MIFLYSIIAGDIFSSSRKFSSKNNTIRRVMITEWKRHKPSFSRKNTEFHLRKTILSEDTSVFSTKESPPKQKSSSVQKKFKQETLNSNQKLKLSPHKSKQNHGENH
jgi:hypothetical protein